jgi:hypothetical protein
MWHIPYDWTNVQTVRNTTERTTVAANVTKTTKGCATNVDTSKDATKQDAPPAAKTRGTSDRRPSRASVSGRRRRRGPDGEARESAMMVAMRSKIRPERERALEAPGSGPVSEPDAVHVRERAELCAAATTLDWWQIVGGENTQMSALY